MFALHETTRKQVCRTAFFALCVAPTLATVTWIGSHHFPGRKGRIARELSDTLDVHVKLANWREPRPRVVRSSGLALSDPRSGFSLAEIAAMESRSGGGTHIVSADAVTVDCDQLGRLADKINSWLANLPPDVREFRVGKFILKYSDAAASAKKASDFVLRNVQGRIDRDATGRVRAHFEGQATGGEPSVSAAIRVTLEPSLEKESSAAIVTLETQGAAVPARVLTAAVPGFGGLGPVAHFRGVVRWSLDRPELRGGARGRLENVDIAASLSANSSHAIGGHADIELAEMRWRGSRLEELAGSMRMENGQVSRSLVDAAVKLLYCVQKSEGRPPTVVTESTAATEMIAIDLLACRFQLDGKGLTLSGDCPPEMNLPKGCLAVSGLQPLLLEPPYVELPLGAWVQFVTAPGASWLPATREAVEVAERLPLPEAAAAIIR